jgi:hypothetical protein
MHLQWTRFSRLSNGKFLSKEIKVINKDRSIGEKRTDERKEDVADFFESGLVEKETKRALSTFLFSFDEVKWMQEVVLETLLFDHLRRDRLVSFRQSNFAEHTTMDKDEEHWTDQSFLSCRSSPLPWQTVNSLIQLATLF